MPVSVHMALQFLKNGGEEAEKVYDNVKKHQDPLTKYDMDRITRLRKIDKRHFRVGKTV